MSEELFSRNLRPAVVQSGSQGREAIACALVPVRDTSSGLGGTVLLKAHLPNKSHQAGKH
jgi:hypothetical protein